MASPQLEDGYTPIANEIIEALMTINLSAYESRVLWFIFRKTYGFQKKTDWITLSQFSQSLNLDRRLIHRAIKKLSSKEMIVIQRDDGIRVKYGFQKDYRKWKVSSKEMTVIYTDDGLSSKQMTRLSSKQIPTKETITKETITKEKHILSSSPENVPKNGVPYAEIISYLNKQTGRDYKPSTPKTKRLIQTLWTQGFTIEDFHRVIDTKTREWLPNPDFSKFLRPETLFGPKFEGYLNQGASLINPSVSPKTARSITNLQQWMMEDDQE